MVRVLFFQSSFLFPLFRSIAYLFHFVRGKRNTIKVNSRLEGHISNEQLLILFIDPWNRKRDLVVKSHIRFESRYVATTRTNPKTCKTVQIEAIYQQEIISQIHLYYVVPCNNIAHACGASLRLVLFYRVRYDTMIRKRYLRWTVSIRYFIIIYIFLYTANIDMFRSIKIQ